MVSLEQVLDTSWDNQIPPRRISEETMSLVDSLSSAVIPEISLWPRSPPFGKSQSVVRQAEAEAERSQGGLALRRPPNLLVHLLLSFVFSNPQVFSTPWMYCKPIPSPRQLATWSWVTATCN